MGSRLLVLLMCKWTLFSFPSQFLQSRPVALNSGDWGNYMQFGRQHLKSQHALYRDMIKLGPCQFKQKSFNLLLTRPNQFSLISSAIITGAFLSTRKNGLRMLIKPCTVKCNFWGSSLSSLQHSEVQSLLKNGLRKCTELLHVNVQLGPSPPQALHDTPSHTLQPSSSRWIVSFKYKGIFIFLGKWFFSLFSTQMISLPREFFAQGQRVCYSLHTPACCLSALSLSPTSLAPVAVCVLPWDQPTGWTHAASSLFHFSVNDHPWCFCFSCLENSYLWKSLFMY